MASYPAAMRLAGMVGLAAQGTTAWAGEVHGEPCGAQKAPNSGGDFDLDEVLELAADPSSDLLGLEAIVRWVANSLPFDVHDDELDELEKIRGQLPSVGEDRGQELRVGLAGLPEVLSVGHSHDGLVLIVLVQLAPRKGGVVREVNPLFRVAPQRGGLLGQELPRGVDVGGRCGVDPTDVAVAHVVAALPLLVRAY